MLNRFIAGNPFAGVTTLLSLVLIAAVSSGCTSASGISESSETTAETAASPGVITAVGVHDGALYLALSHGIGCELRRLELEPGASQTTIAGLETCPDRIESVASGLLVREGGRARIVAAGASGPVPVGRIVAADNGSHVTEEGDRLVWHRDGTELPLPKMEPETVTMAGGGVVGVEADGDARQVVRFDVVGDGVELKKTILIESIGRVGWIAIDDDEMEMTLSAEQNGSLDIAIANLEQPIMNWIFPDPADEERPRFSPVGYKLSYVIRNPGGDVLRTVHVPTAAMVLLDFPHGVVRDYVWLPDGERMLVAVSSPLASDHVVEATYEGSTRRTFVEPEVRFERDVDRIPGTPPGSILILPSDLGYGDRRPLVIWSSPGDGQGLDFDPELVPLLERNDIGIILVPGSLARLSPSFSESIAETPWVNPSSIFVVGDVDDDALPDGAMFFSHAAGPGAARRIVEAIDGRDVSR